MFKDILIFTTLKVTYDADVFGEFKRKAGLFVAWGIKNDELRAMSDPTKRKEFLSECESNQEKLFEHFIPYTATDLDLERLKSINKY